MAKKSSKKFDNAPYARRVEKPWGWEIHWVPDNRPYMGKIMHFNKGHRFSLQYHDEKLESWFMLGGRALLSWENDNGEMEELEMEPGKGYNLDLSQKHRIRGITDCDVIEVSMPETGKTFRLDDDYNRVGRTEDAKERALRNKGKI